MEVEGGAEKNAVNWVAPCIKNVWKLIMNKLNRQSFFACRLTCKALYSVSSKAALQWYNWLTLHGKQKASRKHLNYACGLHDAGAECLMPNHYGDVYAPVIQKTVSLHTQTMAQVARRRRRTLTGRIITLQKQKDALEHELTCVNREFGKAKRDCERATNMSEFYRSKRKKSYIELEFLQNVE